MQEHERLYRQKLDYFHFMLDTYEGNVYVSDMDTYELLYLNRNSCDVLGVPAVKAVGRKCYEVIQGRTSPCPFCTNAKLTPDEFYEWEFANPVLERTFMIKNRVINWEGRRARLELSHDMYSEEYKLAKKDQAGCADPQRAGRFDAGGRPGYADRPLVQRQLFEPDRLYQRAV